MGTNAGHGPPVLVLGSRRLPPKCTSAAEARQFVKALAAEHHFGAETAVLVASELASNAIEHARSPFVVEVSVCRGKVRVEVSDESSDAPDADLEAHWGLRVVDAVASAWGCHPTPAGKTVWAEVPRCPPGPG